MSKNESTGVPVALFGDRDADLWGIAVGGDSPRVAVARLDAGDVELLEAEFDASDDAIWTVSAPGVALRIERADASTATPAASDGNAALTPCRVSGAVTIDGAESEVDLGGVRSASLSTVGSDSLRLVGAWFPAGHEVALLAVRPQGAKGHDGDTVEMVALGEEHPLIFDPRLSTTYDGSGDASRFGVEMWLADEEEGDEWPRRLAGHWTGAKVTFASPAGTLSAYAMQALSRAEHGAAVYALVKP